MTHLTPEEIEAVGWMESRKGNGWNWCDHGNTLAAAVRRLSGRLEEAEKAFKSQQRYLEKIQGDVLTIQQIWGIAMEAEYGVTAALSRLRDKP